MNKKNCFNQPKVSIVFVNWNGKKYTLDLIDSLKNISYKNYDIIIVDNGSTENIKNEFNKKYNKDATLIENGRNLGLAEGTNIGIREGLKRGSKYILIMNNDMVVKEDFLNFLVDAMEKHPEIAIAGPKIYYMKPNNMIWSAGCDYHTYGFKSRNQNEIDRGQTEGEKYVDGIDCVMIIRSDVLKKYGLIDSGFFIIYELAELCMRFEKFGFRILYVPGSIVWHKVEASLKGNEKENEISIYYNIKNWILAIKKNKNIFYFVIILLFQSTLFAMIRAVRYAKNRQFRLMKTYYIAVWHAIINKTPLELYPYGNKKSP